MLKVEEPTPACRQGPSLLDHTTRSRDTSTVGHPHLVVGAWLQAFRPVEPYCPYGGNHTRPQAMEERHIAHIQILAWVPYRATDQLSIVGEISILGQRPPCLQSWHLSSDVPWYSQGMWVLSRIHLGVRWGMQLPLVLQTTRSLLHWPWLELLDH